MEDNGKKGGRAMTRHQIETICWKEFVWRRSFKLEQVHEMLAHLATVSSRGAVIWENSCKRRFYQASYLVLTRQASARLLKHFRLMEILNFPSDRT